jgi:uncharacterized membrane protein (UPF0127 family)
MALSLTELPTAFSSSPLAEPSARKWVGRAVWALAVLAFVGMLAVGGAQPADPYLATSRVAGFDEGTLKVLVAAQGSATPIAEYCTLLATTAAQHERGLTGRRDLAGYDAYVRRYEQDVDVLVYNRNVPIAVSVAWFDKEGRWIGSRDLEPCPDIAGCPTIAAPVDFRYVVQVPKGGLSALGLGPGSQIAVTTGCPGGPAAT